MAGPYYVRSTDGSDASDGLTWTNAKATLAGALAVAAAGERIWVSQAHAETQASAMTLTSAGTAAAPIEILCGNDAAEPPTALATTATVSTSATGNHISFLGHAYLYGISFTAGGPTVTAAILFTNTAAGWSFVFDTCSLILGGAQSGSDLQIGFGSSSADDQSVTLKSSTIQLAAHTGSQLILGSARFLMEGGGFVTNATPTTVITVLNASPAEATFRGVDLSLFGSGKSLVNVAPATAAFIRFANCKLGDSVALTTGTPPGPGGSVIWLDNCDSGDTQSRMQRHSYEGDVYSETTIVRTGGASNGTTPLSHKMVSSANRTFTTPLYGPEMVIWNSATGSAKTATVEILHDSDVALQDDDVWLEVEALTTSGFPLASFYSDRVTDIMGTPANQASSAVTWTTTGLINPNKQKLGVTFTPQEIGVVRARIAVATPGYTVYADPVITIA